MHRLIVAVALALCLAGAADLRVAAAQPHVFRWSDGLDVGTLDPLLATTANITFLGQLTMAHFVRFDAHNALVPELITEIPTAANGGISADGKDITYHLRRGVRWSDGAPFDADDVVYTVGAILNPNNNISVRDAWDRVRGVTARDKYTVVLRLKTKYAPFASRFFSSDGNSCVLPKHILGSLATINEAPYNALPVGIGPFRYTAFRRGEAVEMEANPFYFRGVPKLRKLVYKIITNDNTLYTQMQTGELDLWATVGGNFVERARNVPHLREILVPSLFMSAIYFNTLQTVVSDRAVRRALRLATDRPYLLHNVFHDTGTLAESVVPRISTDYDPTLPQAAYDPAAAGRLLDTAGWRRGPDGMRSKGGVPLVVNIALPAGYAPSAAVAELLRASWGPLGVGVEVKAYQMEQYFGPASMGGILMTGKFDASLLSLPGRFLADENLNYGCAYAPPKGFNDTRYCNRAVDAEMSAYVESYDPKRRALLARRFQRAIDDDAPAIMLYERSFAYAFNAGLTGFSPNAFAPFDDFLNVDI